MATETIEVTDHKLFVAGERMETGEWDEVKAPYDGEVIGRVPKADAAVVTRAVDAAVGAFEAGGFPQHERAAVLDRAAHLAREREDDLAATIAVEAGKPIKTARVEAQRCVGTLNFSAIEAQKLTGEMIPMEAGAAGEGKLGFVLQLPVGVVGAISPFNFPLNLVAHKLGPSIAAGNATVLKPAGQTPISALKLAEILYDAGLPENWLHVVTGPGSEVGNALVEDERIGALTFTGSAPVGWSIRSKAPKKKVNLELGSTAPLIVHSDGDWETAADKAQIHAFSHAGQSCISVQRILVHEDVADGFTERFVKNVKGLVTGDPLDENTDVGPLISPDDRDRVKEWVDEAVSAGGELLAGGELVDEGRCLAPTVIKEPPRDEKVWCEEIFGPVATIHSYKSFDEALELANDARFGLAPDADRSGRRRFRTVDARARFGRGLRGPCAERRGGWRATPAWARP
jgi:acyl-CoA reductase-like NAD-dependent aldehyde dehydrogenase